MGTIVIEQFQRSGNTNQPDSPIAKLDTAVVVTNDATTSTTPENVTLSAMTKIVSIYAVEKHRISIDTDQTSATNYITINAGERRDFGVDAGKVLFYRSDA